MPAHEIQNSDKQTDYACHVTSIRDSAKKCQTIGYQREVIGINSQLE